MNYRAGQYVIVKFNGKNGDLIVGHIKSVRRSGEVVLINLLTNKISTKKAEVLEIRNLVVSKAVAMRVKLKCETQGTLAGRVFAVELAKKLRVEVEAEKTPKEISPFLNEALRAYDALTNNDQKEFLKRVALIVPAF